MPNIRVLEIVFELLVCSVEQSIFMISEVAK